MVHLYTRVKVDKNERLMNFAHKLEAAWVETVEDLAILIHRPKTAARAAVDLCRRRCVRHFLARFPGLKTTGRFASRRKTKPPRFRPHPLRFQRPLVTSSRIGEGISRAAWEEEPGSLEKELTDPILLGTGPVSRICLDVFVAYLEPWIIDSGASDHMTGTSRNFSIYFPCSGKDKELGTGRTIGYGKEQDGLYLLEYGPSILANTVASSQSLQSSASITSQRQLVQWHRRLGHANFLVIGNMFSDLLKHCTMNNLLCDACEFAKHKRASYPLLNNKSTAHFALIHSDVWSSSRVFDSKVKILRSDNVTESTEGNFQKYLRDHGIMHQTSYVDTLAQNVFDKWFLIYVYIVNWFINYLGIKGVYLNTEEFITAVV
ncbi:Retrovirus-related Pol polyprotein from transposon TNT 1-94 [Quillaja saponaria]|uniref:Retrovirus-related Pol polyprotein from transposon TNT 1-94 n=1 Tax=Quillaja saponaria TaxID=32244 RepID=A0AAD7PX21_QUISA|nr:Retrovirus-related Pol polyprotein from transposon TNT 1-94 [Quillaja saponaria]